ncbi:MAG: 50S ribosomal protein L25/general stress protein Ctc [Gemmatimonadota bacterium]|nr:50S ribosomal protein L25/general stress protein Ctc [Gemmatimonadota bacterium]
MATAQFTATPRADVGTGMARKLRQSGQVPAIIYGHSREPQPLALNTREFEKLLDRIAYASTVIELDIAGKTAMTLIREIQRHPFRKEIIHVDFQELVAGEKVTVSVPLVFVGVPDGVRNSGCILDQVMHEISIHVDPSMIPNHIDVDVTPLTIGHGLHVGDLKLPEGVEALDDEESTVCVVTAPKAAEEAPVAEAAAAAPEAAAEPELIRKPKAEEGAEAE